MINDMMINITTRRKDSFGNNFLFSTSFQKFFTARNNRIISAVGFLIVRKFMQLKEQEMKLIAKYFIHILF